MAYAKFWSIDSGRAAGLGAEKPVMTGLPVAPLPQEGFGKPLGKPPDAF
jgi:hypothetical protein